MAPNWRINGKERVARTKAAHLPGEPGNTVRPSRSTANWTGSSRLCLRLSHLPAHQEGRSTGKAALCDCERSEEPGINCQSPRTQRCNRFWYELKVDGYSSTIQHRIKDRLQKAFQEVA